MTQLSMEERALAMEKLLELNERYGGRISAAAGPLADAQIWQEMEEARRQKRGPMEGRGHLTGCSGPNWNMAVRADGVMVPCLQLGHIALGKIDADDLREVWQTHPELVIFRNRFQKSLAQFPFCRDCPYLGYCTGNCPATAYTLTGAAHHPAPDACLRLYLERGGRLPGEYSCAAAAEKVS